MTTEGSSICSSFRHPKQKQFAFEECLGKTAVLAIVDSKKI
jgi:hypothetical protein